MGGEGELFPCQDSLSSGDCPIHEAMKYFASLTEAVSFSVNISIRPAKKTAFFAVVNLLTGWRGKN